MTGRFCTVSDFYFILTLASAVVSSSFLSGCAHVKTGDSNDDRHASGPIGSTDLNSPKTLGDVLKKDGAEASGDSSGENANPTVLNDAQDITIEGIRLKDTHFDIPVVVNSRVEFWVDYFTGRGRGFFEKCLERSEFFIPYIDPLLKQNGLPEDLVYLAMIESGFNNLARSRAKAVGPWQFITATGKRYGLMVNWWVDERRDIAKSTLAAVEYLRDLYGMFHSWELAAAAYNSGEAKIARAIQRYGTKDFWELSRHRYLRQETRDYVPKIIAAAIISKNRELFGFKAAVKKAGAGEVVAGDGEIVRVIKTDKPLDDTPVKEAKNDRLGDGEEDEGYYEDDDSTMPEMTPATLSVPVENTVPEGTVVTNDAQPLAKPVPMPHVSKSGEVGGEELAEFEVQSPADLLKVARAAELSYNTVKALNPELLRWCTPPNVSTFRIRLPASVKEHFLSTYNHVAFPRQVHFLTYRVKRGETLARIAGHFGIKVDPISDLNGVSSRLPLRNGVNVLLPIPNDRSRTLSSLDVLDPPERHRGRHSRRRRRVYRVSYKRRESARSVAKVHEGT
jgi:hypothetical protein